ncbi:hypothetical protein LINGRAHAP2_LOCUS3079 [Linum grandiflorum]
MRPKKSQRQPQRKVDFIVPLPLTLYVGASTRDASINVLISIRWLEFVLNSSSHILNPTFLFVGKNADF